MHREMSFGECLDEIHRAFLQSPGALEVEAEERIIPQLHKVISDLARDIGVTPFSIELEDEWRAFFDEELRARARGAVRNSKCYGRCQRHELKGKECPDLVLILDCGKLPDREISLYQIRDYILDVRNQLGPIGLNGADSVSFFRVERLWIIFLRPLGRRDLGKPAGEDLSYHNLRVTNQ